MTTLENRQFLRGAFAVLLLLASPRFAGATPQHDSVPGFIPERIILSWTGNPAQTQAVAWRTEKKAADPQAEIARWSDNPEFKAMATVKAATEQVEIAKGRIAFHYTVNFEGLKPSTAYCYRVGDGKTWSPWNGFQTASDRAEPFRFMYLGDEQNDIRELWSRSIRAAFRAAPDVRFIVQAGDLTQHSDDDTQWADWCEAIGFVSAMIPNLPTPGNHDSYENAEKVEVAAPLYRAHFHLPRNGPQGVPFLEETAYSLDYQGVRFVSLDTKNYRNEKQLAWLEKTLTDNPHRWTIVFHHYPLFSTGKGRDAPALREVLMPIYDAHRVDLVLQGHDHCYGRTHKIFGGKIVAPEAPGVIYAVSVSGPKMYPRNEKHEALMAKMLSDTQLYQVIAVNGDRLTYEAYAIGGRLVDAFELRKQGKGNSVYLDFK